MWMTVPSIIYDSADFPEACGEMIDLLQSFAALPGPVLGRGGETLWRKLVLMLLSRDHARKIRQRRQ